MILFRQNRRSCLVDPSEIKVEAIQVKKNVIDPSEEMNTANTTNEDETMNSERSRGRQRKAGCRPELRKPPIPKSSKRE